MDEELAVGVCISAQPEEGCADSRAEGAGMVNWTSMLTSLADPPFSPYIRRRLSFHEHLCSGCSDRVDCNVKVTSSSSEGCIDLAV